MNKFSLLTLSAILLSSTALASDTTGQNDDNNLPGDVNKALNAVRSAGAHVGERLNTFYTAAMGDEDERKEAQADLPVSVRQFLGSSSEAAEHASHGASHVAATVSGAVSRAATAVADEARGWHDDMLAQHRELAPENTDEVNHDEENKGSKTGTATETVQHDDATLTLAATTSDTAPSRSSSPVTTAADTDGGTGSDESHEMTSTVSEPLAHDPMPPSRPASPTVDAGTTVEHTAEDAKSHEEKDKKVPTSAENLQHSGLAATSASTTTTDTSSSTTTTADSSEASIK